MIMIILNMTKIVSYLVFTLFVLLVSVASVIAEKPCMSSTNPAVGGVCGPAAGVGGPPYKRPDPPDAEMDAYCARTGGANNNLCWVFRPDPTPTPTIARSPGLTIWATDYFSPAVPTTSQDVTINFNANPDTNYVNLVVDGQEDGPSYQKKLTTLDQGGAGSIVWPANHPKHTQGRHTLGARPYYCNSANTNECTPGTTDQKSITVGPTIQDTPCMSSTNPAVGGVCGPAAGVGGPSYIRPTPPAPKMDAYCARTGGANNNLCWVFRPTCPKKAQGDANCDGKMDAADFTIWKNEYLGQAATTTADFNADGKVDLVDYEIWRQNKQ